MATKEIKSGVNEFESTIGGITDGDFAYVLVFLSVAAFGAGRILGLDAIVEQYDVGGEAFVERYPVLRYVLG